MFRHTAERCKKCTGCPISFQSQGIQVGADGFGRARQLDHVRTRLARLVLVTQGLRDVRTP